MTNYVPHESEGPVVLVSVPNEVEATLIVDTLEAEGIRAEMTGGYTAGFRAEAPGEVQVLVNAADAQRASEILAEVQRAEIKWPEFDEDEPPEDA